MKTTHMSRASIALILFISLLLSACGLVSADDPTATPAGVDTVTPTPAFAVIGGRVWRDVCQTIGSQPAFGCVPTGDGRHRANGAQDAGEPGVSETVVALSLGPCPAPVAATTQTDANGYYAFNGVPEGIYCITVDPTAPQNQSLLAGGWTYPQVSEGAAPASTTVQIAASERRSDVSFGRDGQFGLATPTPTAPTQSVPSPTAACTNRATFVSDVTIPDKANLAAGAGFVKTWRLQNSGSCPWAANYALVFVGGDLMQGQTVVPLTGLVTPGAAVDLSVTLVAPTAPGTYRGEWKLRSASGALFGIGANADQPFWVQIVVGPAPTATATRTPTPSATPVITGWRGEYFSNRSFTGSPVVRDDANLDFSWGSGSPIAGLPADHFAVRWTRNLGFNQGAYRFRALADDGVRVWVDDQLVINDWNDGGAGEVSADLALTQSTHAVRVEYYEATGLAAFKLWWETVGSPAYPDWKGEYWSNRQFNGAPALVRNDSNLDFEWGLSAPAAGLPADDFSVRWGRWVTFEPGIYRFAARADDGLRLYLDGRVIIDEWHESDGSRTYTSDQYLAGPHAVMVEFYDHSLGALMHLRWERLPNTPTSTSTATATPTFTPTPTATPTFTPTSTPTRPALEASISGRVWRDICATTGQEWTGPGVLPVGCAVDGNSALHANGVAEPNEPGIAGVLVTLAEGECGTGGIDIGAYERTTDVEGRFTFNGLRAGSYCLTSSPAFPQNAPILLPGLWTQPLVSNPGVLEAPVTITVSIGEVKTGADLGWDYLNLP